MMAKEGSSPSSGPTLGALQRALEEVSKSIALFGKAHAEWYMYHQSCFAIVGNAWQDYQKELASHTDAVRGLKALRTNIQKELQWAERHSAEVGSQTVFPSSNAFYLSTYWQQILYSALHQSPVIEVDATMPMEKSKARAKSTKVDIVCEGGKRWIRLSTMKPLSLLSEFRSAESYVVDEDSDEEDQENDSPPISLESINMHLSRGEMDAIASQCSLMNVAKDLQRAADIAQTKAAWGRPTIELVFTRLGLSDLSESLEGKYYNKEEKDRFEKRVRAMVKEMEAMGLKVIMKEDRHLVEGERLRASLPSSLASGEANHAEQVTSLPLLPLPSNAPSTSPTLILNLDLSALVALVSQISHIPQDQLPYRDDFSGCFRKEHWKLRCKQSMEAEESEASDVEKSAQTQHTRALSDQLQRECTNDKFFEIILSFLGTHDNISFVCTKEAEEKFVEILALVGGPTEQERAKHLFEEDGQAAFWCGSKWQGSHLSSRITLPIRSVPYSPTQSMTNERSNDDEFKRLAKISIRNGLADLKGPIQSATTTRSQMAGTGIQRQTPHTLTSILYGLESNITTLTTNTASIKWLVRDVNRTQVSEGSLSGYHPLHIEPINTSAILLYPRSLAEKMMVDPPSIASVPLQSALPYAPAIQDQTSSSDALFTNMKDRSSSYSMDAKGYTISDSTPKESSIPVTAEDEVAHLPSSPNRKGVRLRKAALYIKNWVRGPRPKSTLMIKYYRWWPLQPIEEFWIRHTARVAWRDPEQKSTTMNNNHDIEGLGFTVVARDFSHEGVHDSQSEDRDAKRDRWCDGVRKDWKLNKVHWILLALTFIGWAFGFTFLVKDLWYNASVISADGSKTSPTFYSCTTTFFLGNADCGLNGAACSPFAAATPVPFRCPASCDTTTLGGTRAIGDQLPNFVTLVVGGGPEGNSTSTSGDANTGPFIYRGDSFVCSAAIHAGIMPRNGGGCSSLVLNGAYSGYQGIDRNGIQSTPFNSSFPSSYYFEDGVRGESCTDRSYRGYILNVIMLAFVGFILQPKRIVFFFTLITVGFWHINFISDPRKYPMSVGDPMGDFLPTLFVAYALWRLSIRFVWPAFHRLPLERNIWIQGFFWLGVLLNLVFQSIPLQRLVASDIQTQPGALTALIIIIVIVIIIVINQIRVIRKVGQLPKYLSITIIGAIILGLLSAIPTTGFRLHHYIIAMILLPFCAFPTRLSLIYSAFLVGMLLNGVARWGYDGIIQDVATIIGSGLTGSTLPVFFAASNWTGVPTLGGLANSTGLVHWQDIPSNQTDQWDSFALLVDDVLRLQSTQTYFNISQLSQYYLDTPAATNPSALATTALPATNLTLYPGGNDTAHVEEVIASQPHYLRLAYYNTNSGSYGDFTKAATVWFNGTFVSPEDGST